MNAKQHIARLQDLLGLNEEAREFDITWSLMSRTWKATNDDARLNEEQATVLESMFEAGVLSGESIVLRAIIIATWLNTCST